MIVLGIDQGAVHCGWCILDLGGRRPRFIDAGTISPGEVETKSFGRIDLACVEKPAGRGIEGRPMAHLIEAAWNGGDTARLFKSRGIPVITPSHSQWVASLLGAFRRGDGDALVRRAIVTLVEGWPKVSNVHVRDAAGVALVGAEMFRRVA